ncbi:MAG: hypothetical protein ACRC1J_10225 [Sandaracinobacteroides sp.]
MARLIAASWILAALALAGAVRAQDAPVSLTRERALAVQPAAPAAAPALDPLVAERASPRALLRAPPFILVNEMAVAVTSVQLKSAEDEGPFGPNLLDRPIPPGESRTLAGLRGECAHVVEIGFANGRRTGRRQDLCAQSELRLALQAAARPPSAMPDGMMQKGGGWIDSPLPPLPPSQTVAAATAPPSPSPSPSPAPTIAPVPPAATAAAGDGRVFCAIVEERLPPEDCAALAAVPRGTGAFKTPERMRRGESASVILAISRDAGSSSPSEAIAGAEGREGSFRPAVGRFIEAQLLPEPGLKVEIDPATPGLQDLFAGTDGLWRWTITAEATGEHQLTLRTRVMAKRPDGSFAPRGQPFVSTRQISVTVAGVDAVVDGAGAADKALGALGGTTENLTSLLGALSALIVAAGGLWFALRRFGKGGAKPTEGE